MARASAFLDSSVIITAVLSSTGGSFYLINKSRNDVDFYINEYIFTEVVGVLDVKFGQNPKHKQRLFLLLGLIPIKILPNPNSKLIKLASKYINTKDSPILAAAIKSADYLITLDHDFLGPEVTKFAKFNRLTILKPKDFIQIPLTPCL